MSALAPLLKAKADISITLEGDEKFVSVLEPGFGLQSARWVYRREWTFDCEILPRKSPTKNR
jgi:hypothetical protein